MRRGWALLALAAAGCGPGGCLGLFSGGVAKPSEAKSNLKAIYTCERSYFLEKDVYVPQVQLIGFMPERGNRYLYVVDLSGTIEQRTAAGATSAPTDTGVGPDLFKYGVKLDVSLAAVPRTLAGGVPLGLTGTCPDCSVTAVALGNIDSDPTLDVWSISTRERVAADGTRIPAGQPHIEVNDVTD